MGFFSLNELNRTSKIRVETDQLEPHCNTCELYKQCISPKMSVSGEGRKKILIISESPSEEEDEYGVAVSGEHGNLIKDELQQLGISLNRDCWKTNAVNCRTKGRIPTHKEIKACHPYVERTIRELRPKIIILLGSIAVTSILGEDFSDRKIIRWRGYQIPDEKYSCFLIPIFHPWQILYKEKDKNIRSVFKRDIKRIKSCLNRTYEEKKDYEQYVTVLKDFVSVKRLLERIIRRKQKIAFDYESTGLKPYRYGHKIVSIGISVSRTKAWAFPFNYKSFWTEKEFKILQKLWKKILLDPEIKKIAHNHKFEDMWSRVLCEVRPNGWHWDPMMAEHILDNRSAITGLKFQTYVNYGVRPYDKFIAPYLRASKGEFNTIEQAPLKELLLYNGLDCIFTWMRYEDQKAKLSGMKGLSRAYGFFMRGLHTMGTIQHNGITTDMPYYRKTKIELTDKIQELETYLTSGREAKKFKEIYGRSIKVTSNQDLGKLFYDVLGKDPIYTANNQYKTDKGTLESLNLPFVDRLLEKKKLEKAKGTYLGQFARESVKGKLHPFFDLHIPVSYRSSSSLPNFQNLPKRDPFISALIRKGIIPSPDCVICEADFSGAEVITSVCYHKDKNFYNYLVDPSTDMHRDIATDLWMLPEGMLNDPTHTDEQKKLAKKIRFFAKNDWTFAQFYGDWFGSCGKMLWEDVVNANLKLPNGVTVRDWLETQGIYELGDITKQGPTPGSFLEHCKDIESKMWNERFPDYTAWKKDIVDFYQKYGYIETFFGFRFVGYMDAKQCTNFPIQGTSFHLLVYTLIQVERFIKRHKLRTKLIGQIHDSIIADVHKDEVQFYLKGVNDIVADLSNKFKWLIVPMEIEAEVSQLREDGGNFSEMREVNPLNVKLW